MKHVSRVLAAVDFSSPARSAYDYALALAARHGAELVVVQAVPGDQPYDSQGRPRRDLEKRLRRLASAAQVRFAYRVQPGDPSQIILLHAQSVGPDVIVLGTHQRRGLQRLRLGSVSERVVAKAGVPVLVVPARRRPGASGVFRHVAVAVDFQAASGAAVEHALAVASDTADRVTLLHAVPGAPAGVPPHLYRYGAGEYDRQMVQDARRALQLAVPAARASRTPVHTRVLRGEASTEVSAAVTAIGADLLVVGVPRRGDVATAFVGNTASRLSKLLDVPMLAIPAPA